MQGLLALAREHPVSELERACGQAASGGVIIVKNGRFEKHLTIS
jgi:hypothetical protein